MVSALHIRSYSGEGLLHSHDHAQIVLPIEGALELEVAGHGARLSAAVSAVIAPGERHTQAARGANRSLVLDLCPEALPAGLLGRPGQPVFRPIPEAVRRLVDYAGLSAPDGTLGPATAEPLGQLLLQALCRAAPRPCPFARLERAILADPAGDWSVARMARAMGTSRSQLYRALAEERRTTPARFVTALRLRLAQQALQSGQHALAQLAVEVGFSDQAALTRAMRRETGRTPGAWRTLWSGTTGS